MGRRLDGRQGLGLLLDGRRKNIRVPGTSSLHHAALVLKGQLARLHHVALVPKSQMTLHGLESFGRGD